MNTYTGLFGLMIHRIVPAVLAIMSLLPSAVTTYADGFNGDEGRHMMDGWNMMGGGSFLWIFLILVIGGVVYLLVTVSKRRDPEIKETPLDILKKRYAVGDITKEEYEQMKHDVER